MKAWIFLWFKWCVENLSFVTVVTNHTNFQKIIGVCTAINKQSSFLLVVKRCNPPLPLSKSCQCRWWSTPIWRIKIIVLKSHCLKFQILFGKSLGTLVRTAITANLFVSLFLIWFSMSFILSLSRTSFTVFSGSSPISTSYSVPDQ